MDHMKVSAITAERGIFINLAFGSSREYWPVLEISVVSH